jgi:hypothetical protein
MDRNPVLWREWNRARPSRWMALLVTAFAATTAIGIVWESINMLIRGINPSGPNYGVLSYVFQIMFGLLMLAAIAPTSLSEERQRGKPGRAAGYSALDPHDRLRQMARDIPVRPAARHLSPDHGPRDGNG